VQRMSTPRRHYISSEPSDRRGRAGAQPFVGISDIPAHIIIIEGALSLPFRLSFLLASAAAGSCGPEAQCPTGRPSIRYRGIRVEASEMMGTTGATTTRLCGSPACSFRRNDVSTIQPVTDSKLLLGTFGLCLSSRSQTVHRRFVCRIMSLLVLHNLPALWHLQVSQSPRKTKYAVSQPGPVT
jgi:hypothetical protein